MESDTEIGLRAEIHRLKRRCEVADLGLVNYEQWCVKLKTLCGGDMSRNNISDTVEVVEREIERLKAEIIQLQDKT